MDKKEKPTLQRWHGAHHYSNKLHLAFIFFMFFTVVVLLWSYIEIVKLQEIVGRRGLSPTPEQVFCTMEAKLCPDGKTYVGRSGPKCEFSPCPTPR